MLEDKHAVLLGLLMGAHGSAALQNDCVSSAALRLASAGSGSFANGVVAAISTFGDVHAPAEEARFIVYRADVTTIQEIVKRGGKVPGWGNSFYKSSIDPAWNDFDKYLHEEFPDHAKKLDEKTSLVCDCIGKRIYPNAAAYTAIAAEITNVPSGLEILLVIQGRLPSWAALFRKAG